MPKNTLDIDRKTASKLLKVSLRTLDRYIHSGKLAARQANGRIWLNKKEVITFPKPETRKITIDREKTSSRMILSQKNSDLSFYKDLYEEAKNALQAYQQKLEQANYRIGQLESRIMDSNSVLPKIIERHSEDLPSAEFLKKELIDSERKLMIIKERFKREKMNRIILVIITYSLLLLLPIFWFLLKVEI